MKTRRHRARLSIVTLAVLVVAVGVWLARPSRHSPSTDESPATDSPSIATNEAHGAAAAPSPSAPPPPPAVAAAAPEESPAPRIKKEDDPNAPFALRESPEEIRERQAEYAGLSARFSREAADGTWTNQSGSRVADQLARNQVQRSALQAIDCRQTICRFLLASSTDKQGEVGGLIQAARDLELETWLHPEKQADGTWRMEVFFPKEGYRLSAGGGRIDEIPQVVDAPDLQRTSKGG
jgi:type IV secretory pathway VirB10-like protein